VQCRTTDVLCLGGTPLNAAAERTESSRSGPRVPLRDHVATSIRRYLGDLNGCEDGDLYGIALRELEIPLFAEVLRHCDGNQSRAAGMLGIHRATLRKKLREYGLA
jgi:Fis family transcriptional regulator